jgi:hypothetical protein
MTILSLTYLLVNPPVYRRSDPASILLNQLWAQESTRNPRRGPRAQGLPCSSASSVETAHCISFFHFLILEILEENCMSNKDRRSQTFVARTLALLEERFPWLGKKNDEPVSGANTVDELADLHRILIDRRNAKDRNEQHTDQ